ncbi:hypothetical protein DEO72_LG5g511 [Vigna unguiculata]|uniref:Uncharacterized protein n=1 Tax=Vigna unguiculata TaxID=3917 RepID=A0A4D6LVS5_VIGUN|nr:hypothetical protein DEO72_LG5g511 [Vigna unguiculata]
MLTVGSSFPRQSTSSRSTEILVCRFNFCKTIDRIFFSKAINFVEVDRSFGCCR